MGSFRTTKRIVFISAMLTLVALLVFLVPFDGSGMTGSPKLTSVEARLVSIQPLSEMVGPMCEAEPASEEQMQLAELQQRQDVRQSPAARSAAPENRSQLKPVRSIRDPYAAFSSIAVDPVNNEVVLTDENLFNILVYDRMANTPATAKMTEPKRIIGGLQTKIEFQCGLYIDPTNGDIYAVNNDTVQSMVIFSRQARGNVPPTRELHTPSDTFGIAVDEDAKEMYFTLQDPMAVVVFHKYAKNEDAPLRLLQGNQTRMADPHGIALDTKNQVMFVSNFGNFHEKQLGGESNGDGKPNWPISEQKPGSGKFFPPSIAVYPLKASGDVAPLRVIQGPQTQLNWPTNLAFDVERQELYVANDMGDSILTFSATANGDVAPSRVLKGPKTMIKNPTGVYLDLKNEELWVANIGNRSATVYKRGASGDTPPLRVIRSGPTEEPTPGIGNPHPIAYDSRREEILVPN
jgi:DNA-binding beta-propeller fold protein YncE